MLSASIFTTESWKPSAGVAACLGLNLACYRLDTQSCCWEQNVSLSTHEEVQCTLDKMLPLNNPTPIHTHTHTRTHTHNPSSPHHLCPRSLCGLCISPPLAGRRQQRPSSGLSGCTQGVQVSWAAWANIGSAVDPKSNPYVPLCFTPAHRLTAKSAQ